MKNKLIAMILAGGQGSRLGKLTKELAKPAVSFGGRYRIIDFALSNCVNSGIHNVGVVTQYEPLLLNEHIANGESWGLNRRDTGISILQPYSSDDGEKWFRGTAHAIYQNIDYIDRKNPENILILSGDHIYKMDYEKMFRFHEEKQADLTVSVIEVESKEASRFGIMNTNEAQQILSFEEKPEHPKSNLASMGIYIFKWEKLKKYLIDSYQSIHHLEDFGKDVIPAYINKGENVVAYNFYGYWKDVGTIDSLWEANMEFIAKDNLLDLGNKQWRIYTKNMLLPPQFITKTGNVINSRVVDGCEISGNVVNSVISTNAKIGKNSKITNSVIMPNVVVGEDVRIERAIIGENAIIENDTLIHGTKEIEVVGFEEIVGGAYNEAK